MGFYSEQILPHVIDWVMRSKDYVPLRKKVVTGVKGQVLEIGFGSGLNLSYYPAAVEKLLTIEPAQKAVKLARKHIVNSSFPVECVGSDAEKIPLPDNCIDHVISTFTLCTIPDVASAIFEIKRVLRPGGEFHFLEHGLAPRHWVSQCQCWLTPIQRRVGGGCHLDRPIARVILEGGLERGFSITNLETFNLGCSASLAYYYLGSVKKNHILAAVQPFNIT